MKASKIIRALVASALAALVLTAGCADKGPPPPPPGVAVVGFAPDYSFWDGYEYAGWYGGEYYYWGPRRVWAVCDPVRSQRVNVWVKTHPDWRARAVPNVQHPVEVNRQPRPAHPSPVRHADDRDH